jgi:serine/threonine protein kinase
MNWVALQIWECLTALRENDILHRDLRSVNLMMCEGGRLKLIDFDCAFIRGFSNNHNLTFAFAETTTAPEVIHLMTTEEATKGSMTN